jgi:hypothetical protein
MFYGLGTHIFGSTYLGVAPAPRNYEHAVPQHNSSISPFRPDGQRCHLLDVSTTTYFFGFKGFIIDVKAWAACISSLTQLVCTPATPLIA